MTKREAAGRGRGRGGSRGRGGRSIGQGDYRFEYRQQNERKQGNKSGVQCYYCKKYGHVKADYWKWEKQANYVEHEEEKDVKLFMAYEKNATAHNNIWYLDSGCSNHMSGAKSSFKELDEAFKSEVTLGDDNQVQVDGKGTVAIRNSYSNVNLLHSV